MEYLAKTLVLYGPNASGKSNVLYALISIFDIVLNSRKLDMSKDLQIIPFMLDEKSKNKPTELSIKFIKNNCLYSYIIELDKQKIISEALYVSPPNNYTGKLKKVFERKSSDTFNNNYDKSFLKKRFIDEIKYNRAYLSVAGHANDKEVIEAYNWFLNNTLNLIDDKNYLSNYTKRKLYNLRGNNKDIEPLMKYINKIVSNADLSISGYQWKFLEVKLPKDLPEDSKEYVNKDFIEKFGVQITSIHKNGTLPLNWESQGTQVLFDLSGCTYDAINKDKLLVIDEIESLHPELLKHLILSFHKNSKKAQMIFTCHDPILLNSKIMNKSQIWFTQKDYDNAFTELYSLKDINGLREDTNYTKEYMKGVFGAYPFIEHEGFFDA
jgi:uncharacterized protein